MCFPGKLFVNFIRVKSFANCGEWTKRMPIRIFGENLFLENEGRRNESICRFSKKNFELDPKELEGENYFFTHSNISSLILSFEVAIDRELSYFCNCFMNGGDVMEGNCRFSGNLYLNYFHKLVLNIPLTTSSQVGEWIDNVKSLSDNLTTFFISCLADDNSITYLSRRFDNDELRYWLQKRGKNGMLISLNDSGDLISSDLYKFIGGDFEKEYNNLTNLASHFQMKYYTMIRYGGVLICGVVILAVIITVEVTNRRLKKSPLNVGIKYEELEAKFMEYARSLKELKHSSYSSSVSYRNSNVRTPNSHDYTYNYSEEDSKVLLNESDSEGTSDTTTSYLSS
ncbi:hypothetical protein SNEBB_004500 [Seison nebaliae]|nr:hypothetical protein SNEBB_004500 [Seison nebaliae]